MRKKEGGRIRRPPWPGTALQPQLALELAELLPMPLQRIGAARVLLAGRALQEPQDQSLKMIDPLLEEGDPFFVVLQHLNVHGVFLLADGRHGWVTARAWPYPITGAWVRSGRLEVPIPTHWE